MSKTSGSKTPGWQNATKALQNSYLRTYLLGRGVFQISNWMYRLAIGWMAWDLTHSAAWLGVLAFLDQFPSLVTGPLAGALMDRMSAVRYLRYTQTLLLIQALLFVVLIELDLVNLWVLVGFALFYGTVYGAQQPANQSIIPTLVTNREDIVTAYGLNALAFNLANFVGPMIAGPMISVWGTSPVIFANALGAAVFSVCLAVMRTTTTAKADDSADKAGHSNLLAEIRDGLSYVVGHRGIAPTMAMLAAVACLPFSIERLLPSLADGVYQAGPNGLAWMTAVMGVGAMSMSLYMSRRAGISGLTTYVDRTILVLGFSFIALAFMPSVWVALVPIFAIGYAIMAVRAGTMTLFHYCVDPGMRGRMSSFYGVVNHAGPAVGALVLGALADLFGMRTTLVGVGAFALAIWVWAAITETRRAAVLEVEGKPEAPGKH